MLTTNNNQSLYFSVSDGTAYVAPGSVLVGRYVMSFRGGSIPFSEMTRFDTTTHSTDNYIQNSVLSIYNFKYFPDLTANYSAPISSEADLTSFYMSDSSMKPIYDCLFFYDGTNVSLKNSSRIF